MKKIFAIALALVMVLSMASAFAMTCNTNWSWDCAVEETDCGKAKVEVIPYVVENGCGTPRIYNGNACATAINGENIYWAVKLTTEADFSTEWAATASVKVTVKGTTKDVEFTVKGLEKLESSKEYYVKATTKKGNNEKTNVVYSWEEVDEEFEISDVIFKNVVKDAYKAKVCAQLTAGLDLSKKKTTKSNGYTISYNPNEKTITFENTDATVVLVLDANDKVWLADVTTDAEDIYGKLTVDNFKKAGNRTTANITIVYENMIHWYENATLTLEKGTKDSYTFKSGDEYDFTVTGIKGDTEDPVDVALGQKLFGFTTKGYNKAGDAYLDASNRNLTYGFSCAPGKFLYNVFQKFNIDFGTCMTKKAINKNFGWDDDFGKVCYSWNTKGVAIVNPECQIEIPKTGDVSVVAYAVMALVAAAGAMGLKK